jgi:Tol biopolymer transport system component
VRNQISIGIAVPLGILVASPLSAQVTQRVDLASDGTPADADALPQAISGDGRFVAFVSAATNLVPGDTNASSDVFVRDRTTGTTERVSVDSAGVQGDADSVGPSMSDDGRYVAFWSFAGNLVPGDTNGVQDVFVRDRQSGTTERVSLSTGGAQANGESPSISNDGRYVAFSSGAGNLVPGDTNGNFDVFVRDRQTATTLRVSVHSSGAQANGYSDQACISGDGRFVAFQSEAPDLVAGDTNAARDVFVRDLQTGTTERVSTTSGGAEGNNDSVRPSITPDGRYVAFDSRASDLVPGDVNGAPDAFLRDRQSSTTEKVSVATGGAGGNGDSYAPTTSDDGRYVAFLSGSNNLVAGDSNSTYDVFVHDRQAVTTVRASVSSSGAQANSFSQVCVISADGRYVAFESSATNLVPADVNGSKDAFVRDLQGAPDFTSLCDPGAGGVMPCPCSNPPSGLGRGCGNSAGSGGAILAASGGTYLSSDSLVFTTSGERPIALSIVSQWTGANPAGAIFGQGIRCTSGTFKRLYTKQASGGSITAPDFAAGEPQVSVRSAALGDAILAGQSRWHLVYYRDPNVSGGCPAASTFNCTQTGRVIWQP